MPNAKHSSAVHVAVHHLDLVLAITVDDTTANVPAQLELVAFRREHLRVGRAASVGCEVRYLHGGGRSPIAGIDALVQSAAVHSEGLLLDGGALWGRGGGAVAARAEGLTAALAGLAIDGVAADIFLDFTVGATGPLGLAGFLGCGVLVITLLGVFGALRTFGAFSILRVLGVLRLFTILSVLGLFVALSALGFIRAFAVLRAFVTSALILLGRRSGTWATAGADRWVGSGCSLFLIFRLLGLGLGLGRCLRWLGLSSIWLGRWLGGSGGLGWLGWLRWASSNTADVDLGAVHEGLVLSVQPYPGKQSVALGHVGRYLEVEGLSLRWAILGVQWASTVVGCSDFPGLTLVYRETNLARAAIVSWARSFGVVWVVGKLEVGILSGLPCYRSIFGVELVEMTTAETRARLTRTTIGSTASEGKVELLVDRGWLLVDRRGCA
jgi:hypothetical protein